MQKLAVVMFPIKGAKRKVKEKESLLTTKTTTHQKKQEKYC
ncbi:hypothetical protein AWRI1631_142320 [Saccharomyces cerevisiae AWRI1631]|uniref:Uncharacterized protein n=1 Tax=Saccharomyces cerevisiae (strain AWRI1631) TaxID=545124 RepID=B5VQV4_YEAS6|nr:hypothetical protein AWRI1631_142320 [Saccharomyces cerevisiae AWRI1631]